MTLRVAIVKIPYKFRIDRYILSKRYSLKSDYDDILFRNLSDLYRKFNFDITKDDRLALFIGLTKDGGENDEMYARVLRFLGNTNYSLEKSFEKDEDDVFIYEVNKINDKKMKFYFETKNEISALLDLSLIAWFYNKDDDIKKSVEKALISIDKFIQYEDGKQIQKEYLLRNGIPIIANFTVGKNNENIMLNYKLTLMLKSLPEFNDVKVLSQELFDYDLDLCMFVLRELYEMKELSLHPNKLISLDCYINRDGAFEVSLTLLMLRDYLFKFNFDFLSIYINWFEEYIKILELIRLYRIGKDVFRPLTSSVSYPEPTNNYVLLVSDEETGFYERILKLGNDEYRYGKFGIFKAGVYLHGDIDGLICQVRLGDLIRPIQSGTKINLLQYDELIKFNGVNIMTKEDNLLLSIKYNCVKRKGNLYEHISSLDEINNIKGVVSGEISCLAYLKKIYDKLQQEERIEWTPEKITAVYVIGMCEKSLNKGLGKKYREEIEKRYTRAQIAEFIADVVSEYEIKYLQLVLQSNNFVVIRFNNFDILIVKAYKQDTLKPVVILYPLRKLKLDNGNFIRPEFQKEPIWIIRTHSIGEIERFANLTNIFGYYFLDVDDVLKLLIDERRIPKELYDFFDESLRLRDYMNKREELKNLYFKGRMEADKKLDNLRIEYGRWYVKEGMKEFLSQMNIRPNEPLVNIARKILKFFRERFGVH